ncbi:hypothetical protein [Streptomyces sp. TP-A0356]|uniref:hypothetical protein n=1 Tax=Streptomyces sp. TP-A0356 TaxID=1359208 RepID=UPI0006E2A986|nr:hypothetical protein [Streptomyces sp. TP-A0356]
MSNQPHEGYDGYAGYDAGYDPYEQQQQQQQQQPQQPRQPQHPQQQGWYDPNAGYPQQQPHQQHPYPQQPYQQQSYQQQPHQQQPYPQQWEGQPRQGQAYGQPLPPETPVYEPQGHGAPGAGGLAHASHPNGTTARGGGGTRTTTRPQPAAVDMANLAPNQRARLEGRSPIIDPGLQPAALTAVLGALLAGAAPLGAYALVVPLVILQGVTAAGWFRLNGMWPARQGIALAFLGAVAADVALLVAGREHAPAAILGTLGVWVLLALVLQLRSHADPDERMHGLMATVASSALSIVAAGHLAAEPRAVTVGAVAVAAAVLARALPLPTAASVVVALLAAAGAGIAMGSATGLGTSGAFLGLGAGVCGLIGHRVAGYDYPSRFVHFTAGVALPLTVAAPVIYLLGRAIGQG